MNIYKIQYDSLEIKYCSESECLLVFELLTCVCVQPIRDWLLYVAGRLQLNICEIVTLSDTIAIASD